MQIFRLSVKDKGRTVLPSALQKACGFAPGTELIARTLGQGQFLVETHDAVLERIRSGVQADSEDNGVDALQEWRLASDAERNENLASPDLPDEATSQSRGTQLLSDLGL